MEQEDNTTEVLEFFETEEKRVSKNLVFSWLAILLSLVCIGVTFFFLGKASELADLSVQMTNQVESGGVKTLLEIVDKKLALLREELKIRNNQMFIVGGLVLGGGVSGLLTHKANLRKARMMKELARAIVRDS